MLVGDVKSHLLDLIALPYYDPRTEILGPLDHGWRRMVRAFWRPTGWGPRGDNGSARGRVRATQPASFLSLTN